MSYEGLWEQKNEKKKVSKQSTTSTSGIKRIKKILDSSVELNFFNMDSVISPTEICITQD